MVVKPVAYKTLFGIGEKRGLTIQHMDVVTTFLYRFLDETIYIIQLTLFEVEGAEYKVDLLRKALYGLKQPPRVWYQTLSELLEKMGFKRTEADHGVFVSEDIFIAIYVDDLLIMSKDILKLDDLQQELKTRFRMTDFGEVSHYLGIEVDINREKSEITLRQNTYLKKILQRFQMQDCIPMSTHMEPGKGNLLLPSLKEADKRELPSTSLLWNP